MDNGSDSVSLALFPKTKGVVVELGRIAATDDEIDWVVASSVQISSTKGEGAALIC